MKKHIKKIKLSTVCDFLERDLIPNVISIGFDSSPHATGIAIIRTTESYLIVEKTHKIEVPEKFTKLDAVDLFTEQLEDFKTSLKGMYKFDVNFIEDCYVGFNPQTALWLARIGILAYDRFKRLSKKSCLIYPSSARKRINFKKSNKKVTGKKLKKELIDYINKALDLKVEDTDIADSLILALAGLVMEE